MLVYPDKRIMAIEKMGPILQTWSEELNITREIADMYNLVVGEDRTFANTILLRLANAFKCGDNHTRQCVLKVFLLEMPRIRKERKWYNGILAKRRVPNYIEMLKRVKVVYDTGDAESKTLSLRLFGCWVDLAKDSTHIRHIVLQSLQSSNISEVILDSPTFFHFKYHFLSISRNDIIVFLLCTHLRNK